MAGTIGSLGALNTNLPISNQVDLTTLMFAVQSERTILLDGMVRDQAAKIQYNNERLKELNEAMSKVNNLGQSGGNLGNISMQALNPQTGNIENMTVQQFLDMKGVQTPNTDGDNNYSKEEIALITTNIKNSIDSLTSTSQLDMTQLQSTMSKYNQTFEALSNFISKYFQSLQTITGSLR